MNCHECNKAITDNEFYYSFEDTNEICPKCYGIEIHKQQKGTPDYDFLQWL